jgi:hypothetical protein
MDRWTIATLNETAKREGLKLRTGGELPVPTPARHCTVAEEPPLFAWIEEREVSERRKASREARKRFWLVRASFLTKRGWSVEKEVRIRAAGLVGATALGLREAKRTILEPRTRVQATRVQILPVAK